MLQIVMYFMAVVAFRPDTAAFGESQNAAITEPVTGAGVRAKPELRSDLRVSDLEFAHLTTKDGLSQGYVVAILQDRLGFMWFGTRDGLNRYDGNTFVVYKNNPENAYSLNSNFIQDLIEDNQGYLWVATNTGVNRFDPETERSVRYLHEPNDSNTLGDASVKSIALDGEGTVWFGTEGGGLDKLDRTSGKFTHYRNDSTGQFVGRISQVIVDGHREVWFVGARGLFHLDQKTGEITRLVGTGNGVSTESVYEDGGGNLWMLSDSPSAALMEYDTKATRLTRYPLPVMDIGILASTENGGSANGTIVADGQNGLWVPSSRGLFYFDRSTNRFTNWFQHDESNPDSLDSNAIMSVYRDRGGVVWVGTEHAGLNILNLRQKQFKLYMHRPGHPDTISPGRVKALYESPDGVLWVGMFPRSLDRVNRRTGEITHYVPDKNALKMPGEGTNIDAIYQDAGGNVWIGGGGGGLIRFDQRTGALKHYRHDAKDPNSLISDNVYTIFGDRTGVMWVGEDGGISRFDPAADNFIDYRPFPGNSSILANTVWVISQDHSGMMWAGTWGGALSRFDQNTKKFVNYTPDPNDPHRLNGGGVNSIHEDRAGTLWVGAMDGLYRFNRQNNEFSRYTENQGLPSGTIRCILEDGTGRLWLSTQKGISRFNPRTETFRNYDVSDGLQSDEFSTGCYQGKDGEMFFGGSNGFNAFYPENIQDDPYVPPVVITSLRIFNKPVPIGDRSVLKKAIPYVNSLALSYRDSVFSLGFSALSYANPQKNRYRYRLENFDRDWNEVGSKEHTATYTNLEPGKYVFRVQASNSDGLWNEEGTSLVIFISPPWWNTPWFRLVWVLLTFGLLWLAYRVRLRQLHHQFEITLDARVNERTRIARDIHDTLIQSFHGLLLRFQTVSELLPDRPLEAKGQLQRAIERAAEAITEGRDTVQGLRDSAVETNDLARALSSLGEELAADSENDAAPSYRITVEGETRELHPILRDDIYRIAAEALRNSFRHGSARQIEVEIRYDDEQFRLRVRDDGKGIDPAVLAGRSPQGHFGLHGMRERAKLVGGELTVWSEVDAGTELELRVPADTAYMSRNASRWSRISSRSPKS